MNRRSFLGSISVVGAGAYLFYIQPTEEQIAGLQEEVRALDERVSVLETQVAGLSGNDADGGETEADESLASTSIVTVEGIGTTVSDKFTLASGQYRVNATLDVVGDFEGFSVFAYDPSGSEELLFNEIIEVSGVWEGSVIYQASEDGEYFVGVENTSSEWALSFEPF